MRTILLVSHGTLAEGACRAARMIYGETPNVACLCLDEDKGIATFNQELSRLIDSFMDSDEILVLADLKGGSPYTAAATLLAEKGLLEKATLISGLNLPMLLTALFLPEPLDEIRREELLKEARAGVDVFQITSDDDTEL